MSTRMDQWAEAAVRHNGGTKRCDCVVGISLSLCVDFSAFPFLCYIPFDHGRHGPSATSTLFWWRLCADCRRFHLGQLVICHECKDPMIRAAATTMYQHCPIGLSRAYLAIKNTTSRFLLLISTPPPSPVIYCRFSL